MKLTHRQLRTLIREGLMDYIRKYGKHSALNLGQVARHIRYPTDVPGVENKWDALKQRGKWAAEDMYYAVVPPDTHHTQEEIDELDDYSFEELLRMGYDPDYTPEDDTLNEFKDTSYTGDYNTIDITGNLPPITEPRRGGGGDDCDLGSSRFERVYDVIFDNYFRWIEMKFPADQPYTVDNNPVNEYSAYLTELGVDTSVFDNEMEMYEMLMTIMAFYVCKTGARLGDVFLDPRPALKLWRQQ